MAKAPKKSEDSKRPAGGPSGEGDPNIDRFVEDDGEIAPDEDEDFEDEEEDGFEDDEEEDEED